MSNVVAIVQRHEDAVALPALIDRATQTLANARSSAEVLEARELAGAIYDLAKRHAKIARAKNAHDELIAAAHRVQGHALEIEARAKYRLADEYDAAQERGEVGKRGDFGGVSSRGELTPTAADLGLSRKDIHEARIIRDAEQAQPGFVRQAVDEMVEAGQPPLRSLLLARARARRQPKPPRFEPSSPHEDFGPRSAPKRDSCMGSAVVTAMSILVRSRSITSFRSRNGGAVACSSPIYRFSALPAIGRSIERQTPLQMKKAVWVAAHRPFRVSLV